MPVTPITRRVTIETPGDIDRIHQMSHASGFLIHRDGEGLSAGFIGGDGTAWLYRDGTYPAMPLTELDTPFDISLFAGRMIEDEDQVAAVVLHDAAEIAAFGAGSPARRYHGRDANGGDWIVHTYAGDEAGVIVTRVVFDQDDQPVGEYFRLDELALPVTIVDIH